MTDLGVGFSERDYFYVVVSFLLMQQKYPGLTAVYSDWVEEAEYSWWKGTVN